MQLPGFVSHAELVQNVFVAKVAQTFGSLPFEWRPTETLREFRYEVTRRFAQSPGND